MMSCSLFRRVSHSLYPRARYSSSIYQVGPLSISDLKRVTSRLSARLGLGDGDTSQSPPPRQQEQNDEPQPKLYNELTTTYILVYGHPKEEGHVYMLKPYFLYDQGFLAQHDPKTRQLFEAARKEREAFLGII